MIYIIFNWIFCTLYHCSSVIIIAQLYVHSCTAFRATAESFHGPYPGPVNKYSIKNLTCAFVSVHHHRPSAQRTMPLQGVAQSPQQQNWCPVWGLWLVAEAQHQQAAGQPADSQSQSLMKSDFFSQNNSSDCMTFTKWLTG